MFNAHHYVAEYSGKTGINTGCPFDCTLGGPFDDLFFA
jgi:hypothetical protein